jgi:hypothetical protein
MAMEQQTSGMPGAEGLFTAALYLATHYARTGCPLLCRMLMRQLACIQHHPDESLPASLREAGSKLRVEWERIGLERAAALREEARARGEEIGIPPLH